MDDRVPLLCRPFINLSKTIEIDIPRHEKEELTETLKVEEMEVLRKDGKQK